ncbi:MAG: hypothetical protein IH866_06595 [Chloroflexi bacterium]|nr:hypothetical protein [Chloroflexota bacterium]
MFDAGSDVIDWLAELTWNGVGIAASILVAVIMISTILFNMVTARLRAKKRNGLTTFLDEGRELLNLCREEPGPKGKYDEWTARVEAYLEKRLGHEKAVTFTSRAGLPPFDTEHGRNYELQVLILIRLARLHEFIGGLSR